VRLTFRPWRAVKTYSQFFHQDDCENARSAAYCMRRASPNVRLESGAADAYICPCRIGQSHATAIDRGMRSASPYLIASSSMLSSRRLPHAAHASLQEHVLGLMHMQSTRRGAPRGNLMVPEPHRPTCPNCPLITRLIRAPNHHRTEVNVDIVFTILR